MSKKKIKKLQDFGGSKGVLLPKQILDFWGSNYVAISFDENKIIIEQSEGPQKTQKKKGA